jgi:hypothetical protein
VGRDPHGPARLHGVDDTGIRPKRRGPGARWPLWVIKVSLIGTSGTRLGRLRPNVLGRFALHEFASRGCPTDRSSRGSPASLDHPGSPTVGAVQSRRATTVARAAWSLRRAADLPAACTAWAPRSCTGPPMGGPSRVAVPATVGRNLTRHRRRGPSQPTSDRTQRLAGADTDQDLLPVDDAQTPRSRLPLVGHAGPEPALADHETHHGGRAADLASDVHESPAPGS